MNRFRIFAAALVASASIGLAGCVTDGYGSGGGYIATGYGSYGGDPYYGWYDDYYYPGTGYYIYDRGGRRHSWNDNQRRYWESRRGRHGAQPQPENWRGYQGHRQPDPGQYRARQRENWRGEQWRGERRRQMNRESFHGQSQRSVPVERGGRPSEPPQQQPQPQPQQQPQQEDNRLYLPPG